MDFKQIRSLCFERNQLFEDPDFPANDNSIFYHQKPNVSFQWKRPHEIVSSPNFVVDDRVKYDVTEGKYGSGQLVTALGIVNQYRSFFYRVVPANQGFWKDDEYSGVFYFWFWWAGEWKEVIIDDRLPTVDGELVFVHCDQSNQFWASLLEKAYAKLHGSYEAMIFASTVDVINDLTGGSTDVIGLSVLSLDPVDSLRNSMDTTTICTASTSFKTDNTEQEALFLIQSLKTKDGRNSVVQLKSPPGRAINGFRGEFQLEWSEFCHHFQRLLIVYLDKEVCQSEKQFTSPEKTAPFTKILQNCWRRGVTAGGCRNNTDTFYANVQLYLNTEDDGEVVLALHQHQILVPRVIGLALYKLNGESNVTEPLGSDFFKTNKAFYHSNYANTRSVVARLQLEKGKYLVMPTTYELGQEGLFTVRIYAQAQMSVSQLDMPSAIRKAPILHANENVDDSYQTMFMAFADEKQCVNAFELQELLHSALPNDYVKSCTNLEVCRKAIYAFSPNNQLGRMNYRHFKDFITSLKLWQEIFGTYATSTNGVMRAESFREALLDVGFSLPSDVLYWLLLRYMRKDGTTRFGDFVASILQLIAAFNNFNRKDKEKRGVIQIHQKDWLKMIMKS